MFFLLNYKNYMLGWLDFFIFLFWSILGIFLLNNKNLLTLLMYAEFCWLALYAISITVGAQIDDLISLSLTFFILGFSGLEFAVGFMMIILLKNNNALVTNDVKDEKVGNTKFSIKKKWNL